MAQSREYTIVTESKYIREYQNEHYRAVILDGRSQPIRTGRSWFLSEEQAYREGEAIVAELEQKKRLAAYGIQFTRRVFTDPAGFSKLMKYGALIVLLPSAAALAAAIGWYSAFGTKQNAGIAVIAAMGVVIASMIYLAVNQFNYGGNMVSYVLHDGNLYRIWIGNESTGTAQYLSVPAALHVVARGEQNRRQNQALLERNAFLHTQLNKNDCWKILDVLKIKKNKKHCKITCMIEKGKSRRVCRKTLHIREGFCDYPQLVRCFEYLRDCSGGQGGASKAQPCHTA